MGCMPPTHARKKPLKEGQGLGKGVKGNPLASDKDNPKKGSLSVLANYSHNFMQDSKLNIFLIGKYSIFLFIQISNKRL